MAKNSRTKLKHEAKPETVSEVSKESEKPVSHDQTQFEQIVAESKVAIAESAQDQVPKRGRGRPRKVAPEVSTATASPQVASPSPVVQPPPDITHTIKGPLIAISKIPAHKHGIEALALDENEALACAEALNGILKAFVPDQNAMNPKTAAVVVGLVTFGSIGFTKYQIYSDEMMKREPERRPVPEVQEEIAKETASSSLPARDYFRRPGMSL